MVGEPGTCSVRAALRSAVTAALKQRDRQAAAVYRAGLGAIDNAEAVPASDAHRAGAIESAPIGVGRADAARRALTEQNMRDIVLGEARERRSAAELIESTAPGTADRLRADAQSLLTLVRGLDAD